MRVFLGRGAGFMCLVITLLAEAMGSKHGLQALFWMRLLEGLAVAQPTYRRSVCRLTCLGSIPCCSGDYIGKEEAPTPLVKI